MADLVRSIRVPSITGSDAESDLQHRHADALAQAGMDVDLWRIDVAAIRADPDFPGDETDRAEAYGVVATTGPGLPAVVLQGHVDVVPVGDPDRWRGDPFSAAIDGDVMHGRGACDMKAGVAANLAVARAVARSRVRLERPLAVHTVVSEEDGGLGALATLRRGLTGEVAVITEPSQGRLVTANAGALTFEIAVPGLAAHGSARLSGHSAIDAYLPIHRALADLEKERNAVRDARFGENALPYGISVGTIHAGDWASSVPDLLTVAGRLGVRIGEDVADARRALERAVAHAATRDPWLRDHPPLVSWPGGQFASGWIEPGPAFITEMARCVADVTGGSRPPETAAPYGSDLRLYNGVGGIPTLAYGPGDVRYAHAPREQVSLSQTIEVARALTVMVARRCGAH